MLRNSPAIREDDVCEKLLLKDGYAALYSLQLRFDDKSKGTPLLANSLLIRLDNF